MTAPFKLPVRLEDDTFLVASDCELIDQLLDATPAERDYIVKAINEHERLTRAYELLAEARHCCDLNLDEGLEPETVELLDKIDEEFPEL